MLKKTFLLYNYTVYRLIPVAVRSKVKFCSCLNAGITGSIPAEGMDVLLLSSLCVLCVAASATG